MASLFLPFSRNTKRHKKLKVSWLLATVLVGVVLGSFILSCTCLNHVVQQCIALSRKTNSQQQNVVSINMHLHMLQMHSSHPQMPVQKINVLLHKNSQTIHMQNQFEIKLFGSCCWRAKTTCESKQIPNSSPKTHSHKMLFSTKTSSNVIETLPDMLASCRLPENSKNHLLHINHRSYLVKTKLKASAGHLI